MKNENLNEYEQILNEMEALQSEFNVLLAKKKSLRFAYKNDKLNEEFLQEIKLLEIKYQENLLKFNTLSKRVVKLKQNMNP